MNLAHIVAGAILAVPKGIRGTVTITRKTPGALDITTGNRPGDVVTSFSAPCAVVPPKKEYVGNGVTRVPTYEKEVIIAAEACDFAPEVGMTATLGTVAWRIVSKTATNPMGVEDVLFQLGLAK